ncbi:MULTISPECIES: DUF7118 family protein [unclassified Halobacterium]|jgi:hypothetical protein|uniref:DUF7118 family protein n=1 Tax=unclassified Halobacterium TaxID=2668073 RepID=UPI001E4F5A66|nr:MULTISPECIES: hypothetical protein [unclassified Halobacterium]MCD2198953.1 hypothetical protein [Halobacterium sp. KA-4]MCD2202971.1 hypothetical protein [Halobacterium sp. KA-6]
MPDAQAARTTDPSGLVADLEAARDAREDAREAVEDVGKARLREIRDALDGLERLFDQYEADATGTGDFKSYIDFQDDLVAFVEELDEDLPEREAFESLLDLFKKRRLSESDFAEARDRLADARDLVSRLDDLEDAREAYGDTRTRVAERADEYAAEVEQLERLQRLGDADLDAPVETLRDPIQTYDERVRAAFREFRESAPARDVLGFVETTQSYPLVGFDPAPDDLEAFVADREAGTEPLPKLLEYAEYSPSKLDHYVAEPRALKRAVGGNRTYLDRLDAEPLTVGWPPAPAEELTHRLEELVSVVARFADDDVLAALHAVRRRVRDDDYQRLRTAAVAEHELTDSEKQRIEAGVADDLAEAREAEQELRDALDRL